MVSESGVVAGTFRKVLGCYRFPFVNAMYLKTAKFFLDFINAIAFEAERTFSLLRMIPASNKGLGSCLLNKGYFIVKIVECFPEILPLLGS
jgi:hypothetical protein